MGLIEIVFLRSDMGVLKALRYDDLGVHAQLLGHVDGVEMVDGRGVGHSVESRRGARRFRQVRFRRPP
jgi:hypothetical protein